MKLQRLKLKTDNTRHRHFTREDIKVANKHTQRCSTSLGNQEIQIKTNMRYFYTTVRIALKNGNPNAGKDMKKLYKSYICWWNIKWYSHSREQFEFFFLKKKNLTYTQYRLSTHNTRHLSQRNGNCPQESVPIDIHNRHFL